MKQLTLIQRHEIYKSALSNLLELQEKATMVSGICYLLQMATARLFSRLIDGNDILYLFPELSLYKPTGLSINSHWWHLGNFEIRISVLEKCVEQSKPMFIESFK